MCVRACLRVCTRTNPQHALGPGTERQPDGTKTFHAPFILPWVWDAAPEGATQGAPSGGPAFVEYHADATHGARLLVAVDDGSGGGQAASGSVSGYNTVFSLGKTAPQGVWVLAFEHAGCVQYVQPVCTASVYSYCECALCIPITSKHFV